MAPRNLPAIKRVRSTRYLATDGQEFKSHVEAFRHETFISLRDFIADRLVRHHDDAEELAHALLDAQDFRIVLLGPKTGVRETGQGPAVPQEALSPLTRAFLGKSGDALPPQFMIDEQKPVADSLAAVEYLAERMALDSGVRWRDLFNSERNAWRDRAREIRQAPAGEKT